MSTPFGPNRKRNTQQAATTPAIMIPILVPFFTWFTSFLRYSPVLNNQSLLSSIVYLIIIHISQNKCYEKAIILSYVYKNYHKRCFDIPLCSTIIHFQAKQNGTSVRFVPFVSSGRSTLLIYVKLKDWA